MEYFSSLNDDEINRGLVFNPLLSTEQVISLIKQNRDFGNYLIVDTSHKLSPELLRFLVSLDRTNDGNSEHTFSDNIISYRDNLSEIDINIILPTLSNKGISKAILYQDLPQYVTESLILNRPNLQIISSILIKYKHQESILSRLLNILTGGRSIAQVFG